MAKIASITRFTITAQSNVVTGSALSYPMVSTTRIAVTSHSAIPSRMLGGKKIH
jgi:hypothetical protein